MLAVAAIALTLIVVAACVNLDRAAMGLTILAAFTVPWNGVMVGGERPGDLLIMLGLIFFFFTGTRKPLPRLPWWVIQVGWLIAIVGLLHLLVPTDAHFLSQRVVLAGTTIAHGIEYQSNIFNAFKFIVAVVGLPALFAFAMQRDRSSYRPIAMAFVAGVAISSLIAFSDDLGLTALGAHITGVADVHGREAGLTNHPNYLAASCVVALPLALGMMLWEGRRARIIGSGGTLFILLGAYACGSRGGVVAVLAGLILTVGLEPRFRRHFATLSLIAGGVAFAMFILVPAAGHGFLVATRLAHSSKSAQGSDVARSIVYTQGVADFKHSPWDGVGFQVAGEATNVYLQELASGGLLLFVPMTIFTIYALWTAVKVRNASDLGATLAISLFTAAIFNYFEADLTDRFYYVPTALTIALWAVTAARGSPARLDPVVDDPLGDLDGFVGVPSPRLYAAANAARADHRYYRAGRHVPR